MTNDSALPRSLRPAPPPGSDCSLPEAVQGPFLQVTPAGPGISGPQQRGNGPEEADCAPEVGRGQGGGRMRSRGKEDWHAMWTSPP